MARASGSKGSAKGSNKTGAKTTPVMQQHAAAKAAHPDCIVFFRLGDFYEMFGDDAVVVADELGLTLTSRNKGQPDEIPMAGIPHHAAHSYIARLIERGHKLAICEQMADPATVKGIVPREVVRVITAGTWTEADRLEDDANNWLCAVHVQQDRVGVALLDLTTAELMAAEVSDVAALLSEIVRAAPREILVGGPEDDGGLLALTVKTLSELSVRIQVRQDQPLLEPDVELAGISAGGAPAAARAAAARALRFARDCHKGASPPVFRVAVWNPSGVLGLDRAAQLHLELVESASGDARSTLLSVLDRTSSPGGARLLKRRLLAPLTDIGAIRRRHDGVETLVRNGAVRRQLAKLLVQLGDLERLAVRSSRQSLSPRDLGGLRRGLHTVRSCLDVLEELPDPESRSSLGVIREVDDVSELREELSRALVDRPPLQPKEGAIFLPGYDAALDELSRLRSSGAERIGDFEQQLKKATGIGGLKVKYTRVFGWYVEVGRAHTAKVPKHWRRKQTVASGERFTLDELDDLAAEVETAEDRFRARELELLTELGSRAAAVAERVHKLAALFAGIDVAVALAAVATDFEYVRPDIDTGDGLTIVDGRHPVVERLAAAGKFVPNDTRLEVRKHHLSLISGPNMAGKSTYLRQVAQIVILGQMGSYVPAKSAKFGVVDRVLSRVGASDNLAGGESTFMVEMRETASILMSATSRSLVILDEVGRGTSTYDGLSIAWAVAEYLDEVVCCRALFATHYHELTEFADASATAANYCVSAREHEGEVVFLHRVVPGSASRSYGVEVARLAGLPESVLARARAILSTFEGQGRTGGLGEQAPQLDLFGPRATLDHESEVLETLRGLEPDRLTGLEALSLLHQLKKRLD